MEPKKAFDNFVMEAEAFFVTKFITSKKIERVITESLSVIFNLTNDPVKKGLFVYSKTVGQGKTMFFDIVAHRSKRLHNKKLWNKISAVELCDLYATGGKDALNFAIGIRNLVIDDLGKDQQSTRHFGDEINVLEYVLAKRYNYWLDKGFCTHITTNQTIEEITKLYGVYVEDRLKQMCIVKEFAFNEGSFRQSKEAQRIARKQHAPKLIEELKKKENE